MIGLLKKDLYTLKAQIKIFLVFFAIYGVWSVADSNMSMFSYMTIMMGIFITITSISYDERSHWNKYALTLPITRKELAISKHVLAYLSLIASSILPVIVTIIFRTGSLQSSLQTYSILLSGTLIIISILLPINLKLGVEKARFVIILFALVPSALGIILDKIGVEDPSIETLDKIAILLPIMAIIVAVLTTLLSIHIVNNKEY